MDIQFPVYLYLCFVFYLLVFSDILGLHFCTLKWKCYDLKAQSNNDSCCVSDHFL